MRFIIDSSLNTYLPNKQYNLQSSYTKSKNLNIYIHIYKYETLIKIKKYQNMWDYWITGNTMLSNYKQYKSTFW